MWKKGDEGKQKSPRARALRDENIDSLSVTIFYLQQKEYFLFEVLAWELFIKYVLKIGIYDLHISCFIKNDRFDVWTQSFFCHYVEFAAFECGLE